MELAALLGLFAGAGAVLSRPQTAAGDQYDDAPASAAVSASPSPAAPRAPPPPKKQPDAVDPARAGRSASGPPPLFDPASTGERSFAEFIAEGQGATLTHAPPAAASGLSLVPPERQPMFKSERTQGTNPRTTQFKTELFTGATRADVSETGTWKHRKETEAPRFHPTESAAAVTSSGRTDNPTFAQNGVRDRYVASATQKNVLPAEQLRVGPGLGYGANVASADGFHPFLRVMPNNVGEYKLTQLPGGVVPGAAHIGQGTSRDFVQNKNKNSLKFYERNKYPLAAVGDQRAYTGPTQRPAEPRKLCNSRGNKHPGDLGCAAKSGCGSGGVPVNRSFALLRDQAGSQPVGFEQFTSTRRANSRSQNTPATAPGPAGLPSGTVAHGMTAPEFTVEEGRFEKLHRESLRPFSDLAGMQVASARAVAPIGGVEPQWQAPQPTVRDVTGAVPLAVGIAAPSGDRCGPLTGPQRQGAFLQLDRHAKRGDQVKGHTPAPLMTRPDKKTHGDVGFKSSREKGGRVMGTAELQVNKPGHGNDQRGDDTRFGRKTDPENVRIWNSLAASQLKTNMFAKTLAEV